MKYRKIRFYSAAGTTAGLVVSNDDLTSKSMSELSRLFPYSEAMKMQHFEMSPEYTSFEAAFGHLFAAASDLLKAKRRG